MAVLRFVSTAALLLLAAPPDAAWADVVAAMLPSSRAVQVGHPATAFATIINGDTRAALGCGIAVLSNLPAMFSYQTTHPATNELTGIPNAPADIPAPGLQTFVIALTPLAPFSSTEVEFSFKCSNTNRATTFPGVNTFLLSASSTAGPDIVALAATPSNDGIVRAPRPGEPGALSVATVNVGTGAQISVVADMAARHSRSK